MRQQDLPSGVRTAWQSCAAKQEDNTPIRAVAQGDLSLDHSLQKSYLILTDRAVYHAASVRAGEWNGTGRVTAADDEVSSFAVYPLDRIADPAVDNEVVGGLLRFKLDGKERAICRFSGACMRDMTRFHRCLDRLLQGEETVTQEEEPERCCPKCGRPYPDPHRAVCPHCVEKGSVFTRVLSYFKPYRVRVAVMLLFIMLSAICQAVLPYLNGSLFYDGVLGRDEALASSLGLGGRFGLLLLLLTVTYALVRILNGVFGILHGRISAYIVPGVVRALRNTVYEALQRLSIGFYTRRQTGGLMQRVIRDTEEVFTFFIDVLPFALSNILTFLFAAVIMFTANWKLAILSLCLLPPLFIAFYRLVPMMWRTFSARARARRHVTSNLNDNFVGARVVKAFGQEESEIARFDQSSDSLRRAEIQVAQQQSINAISFELARELPTVLVWGVGAYMILASSGSFRYGELLTFVNYLTMMQGPMRFLSLLFRRWSQSMSAAQRVFEIVDAPAEIIEAPDAVDRKLRGEITVRDVSFSYEPNKPVLKHISFHVTPGETLGIVGRSGAGKSTLVNLISRLYDVEEGAIELDGADVRQLSFASLRSTVAMVSQETYIFMGTIAENIAYARPDATHEEILQAAAQAGAHRFICRLPDGYDTVIGTGGRQLSGGERQRLSIARAILADPDILVLDEATASVDTETERAIQTSLTRLSQGRTTLSIAHRLSTLRDADRLIVLEDGKMVETGTHAELLAKQGVYYKLYELQTRALATRGLE